MPSYSTNLRLIQPSVGEYPGSWGTEVNNSLTALVDRAIAGTANITMTAGNYTLNNANGVDDDGKAMFLVLGGTPGAAYQVICPAISKLYFVTNSTGFAQTVKTAAGSGISVPNGASMTLRCDGVNVVTAANYFGQLSSAYTANGVMYLNGSNVVTTGSGLVFNGTNLGIGTSSPAGKVDAVSNAYAAFTARASTSGAGQTVDALKAVDSGAANFANAAYSATAHIWNYAGLTEGMRLDSSGNLGLGVTPSAWGAGAKAVQFSSGAFAGAGISVLSVGNAYFDGTNYRYLANGFAAYHAVNNGAGQHAFYVAPSGTAGNAISFTQAMTLDASGNLGLGVTPSAWVAGSRALQAGNPGGAYTALSQAPGGDSNLTSNVYLSAASTWTAIASLGASRYQLDFGAHKWYTAPSGTAGNAISFVQAMTLTSGGDFLVGTGTTSGAGGITLFNNSGPGFSLVNNNNAAATGYVFESFRRSSVEIGSITQNGTTGVLFNTTSDRRLKDNIVPAPSASDAIDAIEIVSHDWKAAPDEHVKYGVIAQDLHAVAPQAVTVGDDGEEIEKTWGVDYSKLVPMLIKEIQTLRARVAALEQA
jgi:hypothetical protein